MYKDFYSSETTSFFSDANMDSFSNKLQITFIGHSQKENFDNSIFSLDDLGKAAQNLGISFTEKNLAKIQESLLLFKPFIYSYSGKNAPIHEIFFHNGTYQILISLINLNTIFDQSTYNIYIDFCILTENIIELSLLVILQMTQISKLAINTLISQNFIQIFLQNEETFSTMSKRIGFYALSNMILEMPNETFDAFYNGIYKKLSGSDDVNVRHSGYAKLLYLIDEELNDGSLQTSVFHLLNTFCYRLSILDQQNEKTCYLANDILSRIYGENDYFNSFHSTQKSRRELFYAIFRLCFVYPQFSEVIFKDEYKIKPFINNFKSSHQEDVEFALNFFCLLYHESPPQIKGIIMNIIPWEKLIVRIENHHLSWNTRFFRVVKELSTCPDSIEYFWKSGVYKKIISYSDFHVESKIEVCKLFISILNGSSSWIPPQQYLRFVQEGVIHIFFDIMEYESDIIENILNCLYTINQKLTLINQLDAVRNEYLKCDAVSILKETEYPEKSYYLCKELGLESQ